MPTDSLNPLSTMVAVSDLSAPTCAHEGIVLGQLARALVFFDDAERDDPRLIGLPAPRGATMKRFFTQQATQLLDHRRVKGPR